MIGLGSKEKENSFKMILLDYLLEATHGSLVYPGQQKQFAGFNHDTRQLLPGEMFVAVRGEPGDCPDFLTDDVPAGRSGVLAERRAWRVVSHGMRELLGLA